jgi:hypothetical protein
MERATDHKISRKKLSRKTMISRLARLRFKHSTRTFSVKKESMNCKTDSREKEAHNRTKKAHREQIVVTSIFILKILKGQVLPRIHHLK